MPVHRKVLLLLLIGLELLVLVWRLSYVRPLPAARRTDHAHVEFASAYGEFDIIMVTNMDDVITGPHWSGGPYSSAPLFGGLAAVDRGSWAEVGHYARFSNVRAPWGSLVLLYAIAALWILAAASIRAARLGARQRALRRADRCTQCGYDLRTSSERCPECGAPATQPGQPTATQTHGVHHEAKATES